MIWELFQADICYCVHFSLLSFSVNKKTQKNGVLVLSKMQRKTDKSVLQFEKAQKNDSSDIR